jgi:heme-degrading monooxygenase HmoA
MTTPPPGAVAVIFTSVRRIEPVSGAAVDPDGYAAMAEEMQALASRQPGYLGVESVRDASTGRGITVSYWADDASARAWKQVAEHLVAQERGREQWYASYSVVVAEVTRSYGRG